MSCLICLKIALQPPLTCMMETTEETRLSMKIKLQTAIKTQDWMNFTKCIFF